VLSNFHRFLNSAEIVQALAEQLVTGKQTRTFVVVLSPVVAIPVELEKLFVVVEHQLPNREQLHEIAAGIAAEEGELPTGTELDTVLDAACGLYGHYAPNCRCRVWSIVDPDVLLRVAEFSVPTGRLCVSPGQRPGKCGMTSTWP